MEHRLTIYRITPQTKEWTSKVQLIEKPRPRQSKDGKTRFQIAVVQDEREEQVVVVLYGEDIEKYADNFTPFSTYLISTAKVRVPLPYGVPINRCEWVIDKFTIVEEVKDANIQDPPFPPPMRLNTVPFAYLHEQRRNTEFDIIVIVVNCGSIKYVGANNSKCREITIMDTNMRSTILTLWEDFADADGSILAAEVAEYPVIVAKRITRTTYAGLSLSTRYNSVILINPPYPQVGRLLNWVRDNRSRLMRYSQQAVDSSLVLAAEYNNTVPIADIQSQPHIQLFYVEGKLSLTADDQDFYELLCSHCGQQYRTHSPKIIHCASCMRC
uniref:Replication protein A 70 kDa DNA-binding subunit B n=1 Tax=Nicotiana tabacum TaxID=4097 RepID=A0A1S3ZQY3_TOBAC|nr:PREDICTED: replication protein A 70 kDa DNA-binding subunit B-like [Nicotiana tabacum]XP_016466765.1 PREDICTED: replication protein A 70 kDa DNA-binding subunit B-like [Nicotiana tabacum]XP_016466766.1 PREDICTED: replication protein A 70 kDa DNA-binding subunit B-like [Nicotiana tabacum]XP_016466767.1 PREDICTED: replication protein A 70 kDa DNA-binding subunit B-like [Nicotiana tabacum]XP_016466768.1 PREDICTED: replication protein A 70 kDa DNA-binding subunit B-like [Nicotiana tabacum]XP_01